MLAGAGAQFFDNNGVILSGGLVYTYAAGTTTPQAAYTTSAGSIAHSNPIVLDSAGRVASGGEIWLTDAVAYKFVLKTATATTIGTYDNITGNASGIYAAFAASSGSSLVGFIQSGTGAIASTVQTKLRECVSVLDFGADSTGISDSYSAFAAAWTKIKTTGGTILIPPGTYLLNTAWTCDIDSTAPHNYLILGYGATIKSGAAVTSWAVNISGAYNNFGLTIQGLQFDQRDNTTVSGAIRGLNTNNLRINNCSVEVNNNKAGYACIELTSATLGAGLGCLWTLIDACAIRQRTGNPATYAPIGINIVGQSNATKIVNNSFTALTNAIYFNRDSVNGDTVNGVRIINNDFEGVTNCLLINTASPATYTPTGCFLAFNRVESVTTFIKWSGAAVLEQAAPLVSQSNYLTTGSVTNYIVNPNSQYTAVLENSFYQPSTANIYGSQNSFTILTEGVGSNFQISNYSGNSSWNGAHLVFGNSSGYHLWVDNSGRLRIKSGAPTSTTDGTVVGTQS